MSKPPLALEPLLSCLIQAQLFGDLRQNEILVEDFSRDSFKLFLDVLYAQRQDWPSIKYSSYSDLFCLADKYLVTELDIFLRTKLVAKLRKVVELDNLLKMIMERTNWGTRAYTISENLLRDESYGAWLDKDLWETRVRLVSGDTEPKIEVR